MESSLTRPPTAALLEELRTHRRLSKQRLAELADVSATYIRNIEAGFDESGRQVIPSANVIQKLARGLARAEPDEARRAEEERQAYRTLMAAAGYLPADAVLDTPSPMPSGPVTLDRLMPPLSAPTTPPDGDRLAGPYGGVLPSPLSPAKAPADPSGDVVRLRDRRLRRHLRDLLESWEALASEDQSLLLGIAEFIAERRRRREGGA
jgi:transcriptional regulator with XRE-family HTH domain